MVEAAPSSKRRARVDQLAAALDVAHLHARDDLGDGAPPIRNPASTEDAVAVGNTPSIEPLLLQRRVFRRVQTVSSMQLKVRSLVILAFFGSGTFRIRCCRSLRLSAGYMQRNMRTTAYSVTRMGVERFLSSCICLVQMPVFAPSSNH